MLHQEANIYRDYYKILDSLVNVFCVVLNSYNCSLGPYKTSLNVNSIKLMPIISCLMPFMFQIFITSFI